ncbi:SDR family oxidoreductase [Maribacter sp. 2307ULW6-5]|uniref:SDR family oxidoreductase n=1 Tax=Maribacter sp. 2307ULW6-5 TaxID=3386275 RepID=UPI0039BC9CDF
MSTTIGIMGCGWLGLPLAKELLHQGYAVKGTTTSAEKLALLQKEGIVPALIKLTEKGIQGDMATFIADVSVLVVNVPPGLRGKAKPENYVAKMGQLVRSLENTKVKKVLFVSSTSVYGDATGTVTEETVPVPSTASGKQLLEAEKVFREETDWATTVLRFGGLIGPDRHPVRQLAGREGLANGNDPVNLIHLDDCLGIMASVITQNIWNTTLNGVYPAHPKKRDYYGKMAQKLGLEPPKYGMAAKSNAKKVRSCKYFLLNTYVYKTKIET